MNFLKAALTYYLKRPIIFIYFAVLALITAIIGLINPLSSIMDLYSNFISDSITNSIVLISKEIYKIGTIPYIVLAVVLLAVIFAIISGLIYSGYFNMIFRGIKRYKGKKDDIITGIKNYFLKVSYVFFELYIVIFAFLAVAPLVIVPAVVVANKAIENNNTNFFNTDLMGIVTAFVLITILITIIVNFVFRLPGVYFFDKKPIEKAKMVLQISYWSMFGKVTVFTIVFAMGIYLIAAIKIPVLVAILNFIFVTVVVGLFTVFVFYEFSQALTKMKKNRGR